MDRSELKSFHWTDLAGCTGRSSPHIQRVNWEARGPRPR